MTSTVKENELIERLTAQFRRSALQLNKVNRSDAEILRIPNHGDTHLAVTTDSIVEEISSGLYSDPYLIGWMAVMVNMSDLAAVGARPIGILLSETLPRLFDEQSLSLLQKGIGNACEACGTFVLGGDTNFDDKLSITGCALGLLADSKILSRAGCRSGDWLYATGLLGIGNAFALTRFVNSSPGTIGFKPLARLQEGESLHGIATACMDTSDGVLSTLDQLSRVNGIGFELNEGLDSALVNQAKELGSQFGIPPWLFLAGPHGEFELLFTVPKENEALLLDTAAKHRWKPVRIGKVIEEPAVYLPLYGKLVAVDTSRIRDLSFNAGDEIGSYIQELLKLDDEIQKGVSEYVTK